MVLEYERRGGMLVGCPVNLGGHRAPQMPNTPWFDAEEEKDEDEAPATAASANEVLPVNEVPVIDVPRMAMPADVVNNTLIFEARSGRLFANGEPFDIKGARSSLPSIAILPLA